MSRQLAALAGGYRYCGQLLVQLANLAGIANEALGFSMDVVNTFPTKHALGILSNYDGPSLQLQTSLLSNLTSIKTLYSLVKFFFLH